jgi:hypothetical protein
MMQDDRTNGQALAGLFDINNHMRDQFAADPAAPMKQAAPAPQKAPMDIMGQMDERHGKFKNGMGLIAHVLGGGNKSTYGDADLLAGQEQMLAQQAMEQKMGMVQPWIDMMNDGDPSTNAMGAFGISQLGGDVGEMFPGMSPNDDPDIVRTTNQYVDSYNEANKDTEGFEPMTFHQGYDIVKNYDADRRGLQASATANAGNTSDSEFATFNTAKNDYISAFENADVLNGSLANVDRGIEMLATGEVDTGLVNGFIFNTFGIGSAAMGEFNALSKNATIDKLMSFKGPTTDFEFEQSEAAAFADIMKGENVNEGTLKTARGAIERAIKRNATLAEAAHGTMTDMGEKLGQKSTIDSVGRNYAPWWKQEESNPAQTTPQGGGGTQGGWDGERTTFTGMEDATFDAIYDSMPEGTEFTGPDGMRYVK